MATSLEEIRAAYNRVQESKKPTRKPTSRQRKELDEIALEVIPYLEAEKAYNEWAEDFHRKTSNMFEREVINYINRQKNDERIAKANNWEGVMNLMSPGQYYRALVDDKPFGESLWYGNSGWVDEDFARRNPRLALTANFLGDAVIGGVGYKSYKSGQRIYSENIRPSLNKAQLAKELNKSIKNTFLEEVTSDNKVIEFSPNKPKSGRLDFYERPVKISTAEKEGIPKGERNAKHSKGIPDYINSPDKFIFEGAAMDDMSPAFEYRNDILGKIKRYNLEPTSKNAWLSDANSEYVTNLKEYASKLPEADYDLVSDYMINDYRQYLGESDINHKNLTKNELAKILTEQYKSLSKDMKGKTKGMVFWHGSPELIEQFDFSHTGENTGNYGLNGPGNYFSSARPYYGVKSRYGTKEVNMQPYLINNVQSTPPNYILRNKGIIKRFPNKEEAEAIINSLNGKENMLIYDPYEHTGGTLKVLPKGKMATEFSIRRNTGIKSLFPHPSLLIRDTEGNLVINRNWNDIRTNYKYGGRKSLAD